VTPSPDGKDALRPLTDTPPWNQTPPADWADIVPELGPKESDFVITKHQWGAFYGTELDLQLRRRGITTIILCGISTDIGVESTARFAYEFGYNQIFAEDAMTATSEEEHNFTVTKTFPRIGLVRKTEEILESL
jgi:nicotinamidase-related amidase